MQIYSKNLTNEMMYNTYASLLLTIGEGGPVELSANADDVDIENIRWKHVFTHW